MRGRESEIKGDTERQREGLRETETDRDRQIEKGRRRQTE